jgi:uncharacterized membrane protein YsdA (DUF1294 family)
VTYLSLTQQALLLAIACMNVYSFALFFIDKQRAIKQQYRISEKHLLLSAILAGGLGAMWAMSTFRHKTQKRLFTFLVPVATIITIVAVLWVILGI